MSDLAPLFEVRDAVCRVGRNKVLRIDDFAVRRGEHWCLFGPNGAGKTMLANLILGARIESAQYVHHAPDFNPGTQTFVVSFEEQQRLWQRDSRLDISEYSSDAIDQGTTVAALLASARRRGSQDQSVADNLLSALGLLDLRDRGIRYLSSGQVRRALLARGLYGVSADHGGLLILDEPLETIDQATRDRIDGVIQRSLGPQFASLYLCRRQRDIPAWASHLALLSDLRLQQQGTLSAIRQSAAFTALTTVQPDLPETLPNSGCVDASTDAAALVELTGVHAGYGDKPVLVDINWTLWPGDQVLIAGPNGCGKSTLLSLIDGDNHKGYGQDVKLFGRRKGSGESVWDIKARFGVVSNELHNKYVKGWRVLDVVVSGFFDSVGLYDDSGGREKETARRWLAVVGLADQEQARYHELSFGQQRLVLLARAMVKQPRLLVLDEPCVGLDDYHRRLILKLLDAIAAQTATQLLYVSHVPEEQPDCINRRYRLVPVSGGGHTLKECPAD